MGVKVLCCAPAQAGRRSGKQQGAGRASWAHAGTRARPRRTLQFSSAAVQRCTYGCRQIARVAAVPHRAGSRMMASGLRSAPELAGVSCQLAVALRGADTRPTNLRRQGRREGNRSAVRLARRWLGGA